jgi:hypothetical protein
VAVPEEKRRVTRKAMKKSGHMERFLGRLLTGVKLR